MGWFTGSKKNTRAIGSLEVRLAALEQSQHQLHRSIEEIKALVNDTAVLITDTSEIKKKAAGGDAHGEADDKTNL